MVAHGRGGGGNRAVVGAILVLVAAVLMAAAAGDGFPGEAFVALGFFVGVPGVLVCAYGLLRD